MGNTGFSHVVKQVEGREDGGRRLRDKRNERMRIVFWRNGNIPTKRDKRARGLPAGTKILSFHCYAGRRRIMRENRKGKNSYSVLFLRVSFPFHSAARTQYPSSSFPYRPSAFVTISFLLDCSLCVLLSILSFPVRSPPLSVSPPLCLRSRFSSAYAGVAYR